MAPNFPIGAYDKSKEPDANKVPLTKPTTNLATLSYGDASATMKGSENKSKPGKLSKTKQLLQDETRNDPSYDATTEEESDVPNRSAVEALWDKTMESDTMTATSEEVFANKTPAPGNKDVGDVVKGDTSMSPSPIRGTDEMKNFLNSSVETPVRYAKEQSSSDKVAATDKGKSVAEKGKAVTLKGKETAGDKAEKKKIKSANDMKSYLNKQLQELEKEKKERGKRKMSKGAEEDDEEDDPTTVEEIDAMIKKLHKLKHAKLKAEQQQKQKKAQIPGRLEILGTNSQKRANFSPGLSLFFSSPGLVQD